MFKKRVYSLFFLSFIIMSGLSLVLSQGTIGKTPVPKPISTIDTFLNDFSTSINPILSWIFGDVGSGELLFIKLLFFIILLAICYYAVRVVPGIRESRGVSWIITIAISLIAIRYFSTPAIVEFVWLPSGVLGVTFATLLPFIIFLFFVESFDSSIIRKVGWISFMVIYVALAIIRWDALAQPGAFNLAWAYVAIAVLSLLAVLFDKDIRAKIILNAIEKKGSELKALDISKLQDTIQKARLTISNPASTEAQVRAAQQVIKDSEMKIKKILRS